MTDRELNDLLKSVQCPKRTGEYWEAFPEGVSLLLKARRMQGPSPEAATGRWHPSLKLGLASACIATILLMVLQFRVPEHQGDKQLRLLSQSYRELAGLFPQQLEAVVLESGGFHLQLSERPDVPASPALFLRVCQPSKSKCAAAVTFSGQEIQMFGRKFEVLADGRGEIMLLSQDAVWAPGQAPVGDGLQFEAGWLEKRL